MRKSRFTEEQIIKALKEHAAGLPAGEVCRRYGTSDATFYKWRSRYGGMEVSDACKLKALEEENRKLKKLLAETAHRTIGALIEGLHEQRLIFRLLQDKTRLPAEHERGIGLAVNHFEAQERRAVLLERGLHATAGIQQHSGQGKGIAARGFSEGGLNDGQASSSLMARMQNSLAMADRDDNKL